MGSGFSRRCFRGSHFQVDFWNQCRDCEWEDRRRQQREREARELQEQRAREKQRQEQREREAQAQYERELQRLRREQREREERWERELEQARERERQQQLEREREQRLERERQERLAYERQLAYEREQQRLERERQERLAYERQLAYEREQQRLERERQERLARERQLAFEREQQRLALERQRIQKEYAEKQTKLQKEHAEEMAHIKLQAEARLNEIANKEQKMQDALKAQEKMSKHFLANASTMLEQMKNELLVQIQTIEERNEIVQSLIHEKAEYEALEKRMMDEIVDDEWAETKTEFEQKLAQWKESCKKLLASMLKEHREGKNDHLLDQLFEEAKKDQMELMKVSTNICEYFFQKDQMEGDFGEYSRQYFEQVFESC